MDLQNTSAGHIIFHQISLCNTLLNNNTKANKILKTIRRKFLFKLNPHNTA